MAMSFRISISIHASDSRYSQLRTGDSCFFKTWSAEALLIRSLRAKQKNYTRNLCPRVGLEALTWRELRDYICNKDLGERPAYG